MTVHRTEVYPLAAFRGDGGGNEETSRVPRHRWVDFSRGRGPAIVLRRNDVLSFALPRPAGAVIRGAYGFVGKGDGESAESTRATFRVLLSSRDAERSETLLEETLTASEPFSFVDFRVTVTHGWTEASELRLEVAYAAPKDPGRRLRATWVDPVVEIPTVTEVGPAPEPHNVVLITADTTRQDSLGIYGGDAVTPSLQALAEDGLLFDNAYSVAYGTTPSHASLMTASHAARHRLYNNKVILDDSFTTLAEVLHEAGYSTAAFVSAKPVVKELGFAQGFDCFDDVLVFDRKSRLLGKSRHERRADVTADRFLAWLAKSPSEPFFAWLHFFDPHQPYLSRAGGEDAFFLEADGTPRHVRLGALAAEGTDLTERLGARAEEHYRDEITFLDRHLGRIFQRLRELGLYDESLIVFVADHGENLLERGPEMALDHGGLFASVTRLPLVIKLPGSRHGGSRMEFLLGNLDVAPTVLDLLGLEAPGQWQGRSFRRLLETAPSDREFRPHLVLEGAHRWEISVRTASWMYREALAPGREDAERLRGLGYSADRKRGLYDLEADPMERNDVAASAVEEVRRFRAIVESFLADRAPGEAETLRSSEHREALRALGYVD